MLLWLLIGAVLGVALIISPFVVFRMRFYSRNGRSPTKEEVDAHVEAIFGKP